MKTAPCRASTASKRDRGFTLVEIAFALLISGLAFVSILSIQSSAVNRVLKDTERMKAMMLMRELFALVENSLENGTEPTKIRVSERTPKEAAESLSFGLSREQERHFDSLAEYIVSIEPEGISIPLLGDGALQKLTMRVYIPSQETELTVEYVIGDSQSLPINTQTPPA